MKFIADENIDRPIVELLRRSGYIISYVPEMEPGITDEQVIEYANNENTLLLTADKDFGELVFRQKHVVSGVLLIRLAGLSPRRKAEIVLRAIEKHEGSLSGNFAVVTPNSIRIRSAEYLKD